MPWHASKSDPRKVYDSYHNTVCVCQNQDQANLIVAAVNAFGAPDDMAIKLRETIPAEKESAEVSQSTSVAAGAVLDTIEPDDCCGKHLSRALRTGMMKQDEWTCPRCGVDWKAEQHGPLRHWKPVALIALFRI